MAYIESGAVEIDKLPRGVAGQGAADGGPWWGRNWNRQKHWIKKNILMMSVSSVCCASCGDRVFSIRTYWRPWQSWSRCPQGRGCLRRWRGRCRGPRPTWRPPPAPAGSRTQARRRNSEKNVSDKLYRKLIKHKPNWTQGKISPEIWRKWTDLSWRPKIRRWGTAMGCQLTRHKTHHIWFEVWRDDR